MSKIFLSVSRTLGYQVFYFLNFVIPVMSFRFDIFTSGSAKSGAIISHFQFANYLGGFFELLADILQTLSASGTGSGLRHFRLVCIHIFTICL